MIMFVDISFECCYALDTEPCPYKLYLWPNLCAYVMTIYLLSHSSLIRKGNAIYIICVRSQILVYNTIDTIEYAIYCKKQR